MKILLVLFGAMFALMGCEATGAYTAGKQANDISFALAAERICGLTAPLAAERQLNENELAALQLFCEERRRP